MCPYGGSTFERESSSFQTNFCSSDSQFEKYPYTGIWKQQQSPFPQYLPPWTSMSASNIWPALGLLVLTLLWA